MALVDKDTIAEILGIEDSDNISDSVYTWATKQFFSVTGLKQAEEQKIYRKFITDQTSFLQLPDTNIKTVDTIKVDGITQSFVLHSSLKFNPDTGTLFFLSGFGYGTSNVLDGEPYCPKSGKGFASGFLIEITYTLNGYTHLDIHDYLIALLTAKALSLFTPDRLSQVKSIKIGNFQKTFGASSSSLESYQQMLDAEINRVIGIISGDDDRMTVGSIQ